MRTKERGAVAVVVAIVLALLLGFLGLSLETGHVLSVRGELQNGADAAALAGARCLNGMVDALGCAIDDAENFARSHPTDTYDVEPFTVQLGHWAPGSECAKFGGVPVEDSPPGPDGNRFCHILDDPAGATEADAANITAVRVVTNRQGAPGEKGGGAVAHPFGAFVGQAQTEVAAEAIAITGSPGAAEGDPCPELPFAIKQSCVKSGGLPKCDEDEKILFFVGLSASGIDSAGLTIFKEASCGSGTGDDEKYNGASGWGTNDICKVLEDKCENHPVMDKCITIKNGTNVNGECSSKDLGKICYELRDKVGQTAQVPLVEYEPGESCEGGFSAFNYTHAARVKGIGTVRLVGAQCETGGEKGINVVPGFEAEVAKCAYASGSCFVMEFMCGENEDDQTSIVQTWSGTAVLEPALVR